MPIDRLRSFADASGPFVSLYVDDTRDNPDAEKRATIRWQAIRRNLEDSGAAEHMIGAVERALLHSQPGVGRGGRAVIAGREGVLLNEHLGAPPSITVLRVSEYPYVLPLLDLTTSNPAYVFAAVDHLGADLTGHRNGLVHRETVDGHGYPVHKPVSAGWQGYDDHERSAEEAVRMNARAVADRITDLVDRGGGELVFLSGEVRARTDVVAALPQRIADRVVTLPAAPAAAGPPNASWPARSTPNSRAANATGRTPPWRGSRPSPRATPDWPSKAFPTSARRCGPAPWAR
ncbi:baeRF2 domain-containing protein [Mycolicibacterium vanbaalenii]|uniref:baeRF2 domain-containing protein n=1 Tax=Mycolicibacterium vanbaalenii TaxID=110539 RepID=UPI0021F355DD|nr:hypothetical protein [Mycolicibacterium vanbaalenii]